MSIIADMTPEMKMLVTLSNQITLQLNGVESSLQELEGVLERCVGAEHRKELHLLMESSGRVAWRLASLTQKVLNRVQIGLKK